MTRSLRFVLAVLSIASLLAVSASAETVKCRGAISAASAAYFQARAKTLQKCREGIVKGNIVLGPSEVCATRPKVAATITKAATKLATTIAKACGGANATCNAADTGPDADDAPASLGYGGTCPNFEQGLCNGVIADCDDIHTCVQCIADAAVDQAIGLAYDVLLPTSAKSKDKAEKQLNKCQVALGKGATKLLLAQSKILGSCWKKANKAGTGACPDGKASSAIVTARLKLGTAIAKACGGADKTLATGDDLTPIQIGFPASCLDAGVRG